MMSSEKIDTNLYLNPIKDKIKNFNDKWDPIFTRSKGELSDEDQLAYKNETEALTKSLYEFTESYLRYKYEGEVNNFKLIQLYRHGQCTDGKKGLGFKPNANINTAADKNMKHFNYSVLLHNQQSPVQVVFSTMTRATTTAANFIAGLAKSRKQVLSKSSKISTEIAEGPSGFGIEDSSEYWSLINPFSGVQLNHRVMLFFSWLAYSLFGNTLKTNETAKINALTTIDNNSTLENTRTSDTSDEDFLASHSSDVVNTSNEERKNGVAMEIVNQIDKGDNNDVILIGHGNSIRNTLVGLFPDYEANYNKGPKKDALQFAEGQNLMSFDVNGEKQLFMLPFRIQVDQKIPGKMNIKATDYAEIVNYKEREIKIRQTQADIDAQKPTSAEENLPNPKASYITMLEYGLDPDQEETPDNDPKETPPNLTVEPLIHYDPMDLEIRDREYTCHL